MFKMLINYLTKLINIKKLSILTIFYCLSPIAIGLMSLFTVLVTGENIFFDVLQYLHIVIYSSITIIGFLLSIIIFNNAQKKSRYLESIFLIYYAYMFINMLLYRLINISFINFLVQNSLIKF